MNHQFGKNLLILIFLLLPFLSCAQINLESYRASYIYEVASNHGFMIGAQFHLKSWTKKKKDHKERTLFLTPQVGFYNHTQNYFGLLYNAEIGFRLNKVDKKWYNQFGLSLGALSQFNAGVTYIWDDDVLTESNTASRSYIHSNLSYELSRSINPHFAVFTKINIGIQFPFNTYFTLTSYLEVGLKYNLKKTEI